MKREEEKSDEENGLAAPLNSRAHAYHSLLPQCKMR